MRLPAGETSAHREGTAIGCLRAHAYAPHLYKTRYPQKQELLELVQS